MVILINYGRDFECSGRLVDQTYIFKLKRHCLAKNIIHNQKYIKTNKEFLIHFYGGDVKESGLDIMLLSFNWFYM